MKYLGIDFGTKKVGLALSDEAGTMGFPHNIVLNTPKLIDEVCALIAKENIGAVVVGESVNFSGEENEVMKEARAFGALVHERAGIPVFYEREDFTSAEARRQFDSNEKSRKMKRHELVDASAAALILTSFLSRASHDS